MKIGLRANLYFCKMTKLRNFYQIFGRILVLEGQVMYQFCFVPKMRSFVVQILTCWSIFQKGNFIKAGSADCRKPCSERRERCSPRDRRDAFVQVKRVGLLHLLNVFVAFVCLWVETLYSLNLPSSRFRRREPHRQHANWATFVWFDFYRIIGFAI